MGKGGGAGLLAGAARLGGRPSWPLAGWKPALPGEDNQQAAKRPARPRRGWGEGKTQQGRLSTQPALVLCQRKRGRMKDRPRRVYPASWMTKFWVLCSLLKRLVTDRQGKFILIFTHQVLLYRLEVRVRDSTPRTRGVEYEDFASGHRPNRPLNTTDDLRRCPTTFGAAGHPRSNARV